jgi:Chlorite dismutase
MATSTPASDRLFTFIGGSTGPWLVDQVLPVIGETMSMAPRLAIVPGPWQPLPMDAVWALRGMRSNERYVEREEKTALASRQEGLGRPASTRAALIPIRKTTAWWELPQDERREIFEAQSKHIGVGMRYLPAIARRLHHCRDLAFDEPFDFLTWFEYGPSDEPAFDELVAVLRTSPEWAYVDWEVDIRLVHEDAPKRQP